MDVYGIGFTMVYIGLPHYHTWPYMGWSGVSICWIGGFGLVRGISSHYKSLQFWPKDSTTLPSPHFGRCCSSLEHGLALIIYILWFHMISYGGEMSLDHGNHGTPWWHMVACSVAKNGASLRNDQLCNVLPCNSISEAPLETQRIHWESSL